MPLGVELIVNRDHSKDNLMNDGMISNGTEDDEDWLDLPSEIYIGKAYT